MLILKLHKGINLPLHCQVYIELKALIDKGILSPGTKLPATMVLAEKHGLSRLTVLRVYEELWALGYLESRQGSYSFVRKKAPSIATDQRAEKRCIDWEKIASPSSEKVLDHFLKLSHYSTPTNDKAVIDMASFDLGEI
jgi:DNA-binding transcriptional regulator YhcF (GntR family)